MAERPYHKAMSYDAAVGLLQQEAGKALDPGGRRASSSSCCRRCRPKPTQLEHGDAATARRSTPTTDAAARPTGFSPEPTEEERVRGHRARAPRDLRALRDRAGDGHQPRRVRHDGAHLVEAEQPRAVLVRARCSSTTRTAETLRCRFATGVDAEVIQQIAVQQRRGPDRLGGAQPPAARQRAAERRPRGRRPDRVATTLQSALVCPLLFNERFIGTLSVYHTDAGVLPRRSPPAARPRLASRPPPSSTTRSSSSRRRKTR